MSDCKGCPDVLPPGFTRPPDATPDWKPSGMPTGLPECTSNEPLINTPEVRYSEAFVIYAGGSHEEHLASMLAAIPKGFDRVAITPDGLIEYEKGLDDWEPPSPIDGYLRDSKNQWLFRPLWESCRWRQYGVAIKSKCQCLDVIARCTTSGCWVKHTNCLECGARLPIREKVNPVKKTIQSLHIPDLDRSSK